MYLRSLELAGFKSFVSKTVLEYTSPIAAIVGPNGSGKSNVAEAFQFVLGEQSMKSMRTRRGEELIWNGSAKHPRLNRASVKLCFDNSKRAFPVEFDEVSIERVVYRDSANEYKLNGSDVRLRDIMDMLSSAHMGSSRHHIISQGEADRVLSAREVERREMVEDALGLRIYQFKKREALRKLERTAENVSQVEALKRELAPHLKFLHKQMEKVGRAASLRADLVTKFQEYFSREELYLTGEEKDIVLSREGPEAELKILKAQLEEATQETRVRGDVHDASERVLDLEKELSDVESRAASRGRDAGKIDGELAAIHRTRTKIEASLREARGSPVPRTVVSLLLEETLSTISEWEGRASVDELREGYKKVRTIVSEFAKRISESSAELPRELSEFEREVELLMGERSAIEKDIADMAVRRKVLDDLVKNARQEAEKSRTGNLKAERVRWELTAREREIQGVLSTLAVRMDKFQVEKEDYERDLKESAELVGRDSLRRDTEARARAREMPDESRTMQIERRRAIERLKIRLEEYGADASGDVEREYKEAEERDTFLGRELQDLAKSEESLRSLIEDLDQKIETEFRAGVEKINTEFQRFFALMFGGGTASLKVINVVREKRAKDDLEGIEIETSEDDDDEDSLKPVTGIEIHVALPHKKVKGLDVLSGGERALTSIALIFAMSQVHPPPFIVLDETDAALDEANSRRYGDMIEELSKRSQLILITHNRETMSRAGIIYGVTMGSDAASKLLSIEFEEAVKVAK